MKKNAISALSKTKVIVILAVVAAISFFSTGCTPNTPTPHPAGGCITTNTNFQQIYNGLIASGYQDNTSMMDTKVHEYTFRLNGNYTVCKVGYQSQPLTATMPYTINLIDTTAHTVIFSVNGMFSSTATSYLPVPNQVPLPAGHVFTLQRIAPSPVPLTLYNNGRLAHPLSGNVVYPIGNGYGAIVATNFYDTPGQTNLKNFGVPYIDLVFQ